MDQVVEGWNLTLENEVTIEIPVWLLYTLYAIGGVIAVAVIFVFGAFAFVGYIFTKTWRPPNW